MPFPPTAPARPDARGWTPAALSRHALLTSRRWVLLAVATAGFALHQVCESLVPVIIGVVVDDALVPRDARALTVWLVLLAALFVILSLSWRTGMRAAVRAFSFGAHDLRHLVVDRTLDPHGMRSPRATGEVLAVATSDTSRVAGLVWTVSRGVACLAAVLTTAVALLVVSVPLGVAVLVATPVVLLAMHRVSVPLEARSSHEQATAAGAGALATDFVTGLRVLKGLGAEDAATERYRGASRLSLAAGLRAARSTAAYSAVSTVLSTTFLAGIAFASAWMALRGSITTGQLVTVVGLAQLVQGPMAELGHLGVDLAQKRASARRVADILAEPRILEPVEAHEVHTTAAQTPPGLGPLPLVTLVQSGVEVRTGEVVGLVVPDARQASELVDVLGFRAVAAPGTVLLGGEDIAGTSPAKGRSLVFAPPRDSAVFAASVRENLAGVPVPGVGDALPALDPRATAASGVDEVLAHLPAGVDSPLAARGTNLSGGQRQRVLLGRALHRPQPVLVLLEPTTAVDTVTEAAIAAGLRAFPEKAVVLVTTSPTLLAACDRVALLADDAVVHGTHHELAAHATYAEAVTA
ncbi:ABC transporter ATP-binding protein [Sanguibacter sp. 25GB23B1]|uniref:ABC transporter ATP-binding protein n=1 Tax=unclassified Sanguibacter TaxID=2645534 RepID=UPI0032B012E6